jgi:hypothetical protein
VKREIVWHRRTLIDLAEIGRHGPRQADRIREAVTRYATDDREDVLKIVGTTDEYPCESVIGG